MPDHSQPVSAQLTALYEKDRWYHGTCAACGAPPLRPCRTESGHLRPRHPDRMPPLLEEETAVLLAVAGLEIDRAPCVPGRVGVTVGLTTGEAQDVLLQLTRFGLVEGQFDPGLDVPVFSVTAAGEDVLRPVYEAAA